MERLIAVASLALLCACSTAKYEVNEDGSKPTLYPATDVGAWPMVNGAHQSPTTNARIFIAPSAHFENAVQLGDGVRIASGASIDEDTILFPNVTLGESSQIGGDAIIQNDVKIGNGVLIRGDVMVGAGSVIEDGARIGKGAKLGKHVTVGADATIGVGSRIGDNVIIAKSTTLPPSSRLDAGK